jgi:hypothetical protein
MRPRPPLPEALPEDTEGLPLALYVEGDELLFGHAERRLGRALRLLHAKTDREACTILKERHKELSVIFCDVDLAGSVLDGILLSRVLRGKVPSAALPPFARGLPLTSLPIVLISDHPHRHSEKELRRYGVSAMMKRPPHLVPLGLSLALHALQKQAPSGS